MMLTPNGLNGTGWFTPNSLSFQMSDLGEDHEELFAEMELIERLPTQERLTQAKRRRALQLKRWSDFDKREEDDLGYQSKNRVNIKFQDHIVVLDGYA